MSINEHNIKPQTVRRSPWRAAFLSAVMPGLGQIYNGEMTKGMSLFVIIGAVVPFGYSWASSVSGTATSFVFWITCMAVALAYLYAVINAARTGRRIGVNYYPKSFNRIYVYLGIFLGGSLVITPAMIDRSKESLRRFYVPSSSMLPTIIAGDNVLASTNYNCPFCTNAVKRGDVVAFVYPNNRNVVYIKRVIGLPGDEVAMKDRIVSVNGLATTNSQPQELRNFAGIELSPHFEVFEERAAETEETYNVIWKKDRGSSEFTQQVPEGEVYLLGDNRSESYDSRGFQTVSLRDIIGKVKVVSHSVAALAGAASESYTVKSGSLFSRIGLSVELSR